MEHIARVLSVVLILVVAALAPSYAQDIPQSEPLHESSLLGPVEPAVNEAGEVLGEWLGADRATYEDKIRVSWEVWQQCLLGTALSVKLYEDEALIFQYVYPATPFGTGRLSVLTLPRGPDQTHYYRLVRTATGSFCNNSATFDATGKTDVIRKPVGLVVPNPGPSDRDLVMQWANGSSLGTNGYTVFRNGDSILATTSEACTVLTVPDDYATWGVAVNTSYGQSARTEALGATAPFFIPSNLAASVDTTVGYVRLNWECASDFATHIAIWRDAVPIDTVPASLTEYFDSSAVPKGTGYYSYLLRSINVPSGLSSAGSVPASGRPAYMLASDGDDGAMVHATWTLFPDTVRGSAWTDLRLYRDDVEIVPVSAGGGEKWDGDATPGRLHRYRLDLLNMSDVLLSIVDYGFTPADGLVSGWVRTPTGAGVNQVEVRALAAAELFRRSFLADGSDDYIVAPPLDIRSNTVTISAWIRREGVQADWAGIVSSRDGHTAAGLHVMSSGELRYNWNDDPSAYGWATGLMVPDSAWTFVALIVEPDRATVVLDDTAAVRMAAHEPEEFDGETLIGRDPSGEPRYFRGRIDEVNVWNSARTLAAVLGDRHHLLRGSEPGLVASWNFNDDQDSVAGDFTRDGNHHAAFRGGAGRTADTPPVWHYGISGVDGQYSIYRIRWEEALGVTVRPVKPGHGFRGASFPADSVLLTFTNLSHDYSGINFLDTTSIGITGTVRTAGNPPCPVAGVRILVDSVFTGVTTDSAGTYSISVSEAGPYTVSVEYGTHGFLPADTTIDVQAPVDGLDFTDTTTSMLSGTVGGNCDIILGVASVRVWSAGDGCLDTLVQTDSSGHYAITLPAQVYLAGLARIDRPDSLAIVNYFTVDTVDLTEGDSVLDFIYKAPPLVAVSELPAPGCAPYDVPILVQEVTYYMRIDLTESYGSYVCAVDSGTVTVSDFAGYADRETTIAFTGGLVYYALTPGYPNITGGGAHPHQKMVVLRTDAGPYTTYDTVWVFVKGQKPREFQYSTVSPEIPLMILRDPPGDQSYSYISTSTTSNVNIGFSFETEVGVGAYAKFRVGGGLEIPGIGPIGVWGAGEAEAQIGARSALGGTQEIRISATEELKTSDADVITGANGDVYMGAALNLLYARTDILGYDADSCRAVRDTGIVWNGNGFRTTYLYTESHILHSVIPDLELMASILNASGNPAKMDSAEVLLNQAGVWRQVVQFNDSIKLHAAPVPEFPSSVSFSAGANLGEEATISSATTFSIGLNLYLNSSVALSAGAKQGEFNEIEGGVKIFARLDVGTTLETGYEVTNVVGFNLADDDAAPPGDNFWVLIKGDPVYGTPVFELVSGKSSCPWEHPTLPREGVGLTMDSFVRDGVPADQPAEFDLFLSNLGQNDETRTYALSLVQGSNPDGAIIQVGGAVLGDDELSFTLTGNPDSAQRATVRVRRDAGSVYDYEGLQLHLYSPCDGQIDTTVSFSVHFVKPCSDVRIARPAVNWIVNESHNDLMTVVLKGYDGTNPDLEELKFEYRAAGVVDWTGLFSYPRALLPADSISRVWDMSALAEGAYELRATTYCTAGSYSTRVYPGMYDITAPGNFGAPQPADGFLDAGDDISVNFTEAVNCLSAVDSSVTVMNATRGEPVDIGIQCSGDGLVLVPLNPGVLHLGDSVVVTLDGLSDPFGNVRAEPLSWSFIVNVVTAVPGDPAEPLPSEFALEQSYPNPFNPSMTVRFALPKSTDVSLVVYDIAGREVMRVVDGRMPAGYHERTVNAGRLSSGIYFYRLRTPEFDAVRKTVLMK